MPGNTVAPDIAGTPHMLREATKYQKAFYLRIRIGSIL